eukprot:6129656-Amphidinium_carterae.1
MVLTPLMRADRGAIPLAPPGVPGLLVGRLTRRDGAGLCEPTKGCSTPLRCPVRPTPNWIQRHLFQNNGLLHFHFPSNA